MAAGVLPPCQFRRQSPLLKAETMWIGVATSIIKGGTIGHGFDYAADFGRVAE